MAKVEAIDEKYEKMMKEMEKKPEKKSAPEPVMTIGNINTQGEVVIKFS